MEDLLSLQKELEKCTSMRIGIQAAPGKPSTRIKKVARREHHGESMWFLYADIAAHPHHGKANKELCTFLTKLFSNYSVALSSGRTSKEKYILLTRNLPSYE